MLLAAALVRLWHLDAESLWEDEIRTARLAGLSSLDLLQRVFVERRFAVPVLHVLVSKAAMALQLGEWGLRLPSVLFGVAGIGFVYLLGREVHGARVGWIAAILLAVSPGHIMYSREARPYALLVLVVAALLWTSMRAWRTRSASTWLGVGCLAVVACNTSFLGVLPAVATVLVGVAAAIRRRSPGTLLFVSAPFLILTPAWLAILESEQHLVQNGQLYLRIFERETMVQWTKLLGPGAESGFFLLTILAGVGLLAGAVVCRSWAFVAAAHPALTIAVFEFVPFNQPFAGRYLLFLLPIFVVLQAYGLAWVTAKIWPRRRALATIAATLAVVGLNLTGWSSSFAPWHRDWRGAGGAICAIAPRDTLVLSSSVSPAWPVRDTTIEYLGYYLGDKDGTGTPDGRTICSAGILGERWLDGLLCGMDRPVCAVLVHHPFQPPVLPVPMRSETLRGITVLFDDQEAWSPADRSALLLMAQGAAAVHPEEKRVLLRRGIRVGLHSEDPSARQDLAQTLLALAQRCADDFSPSEHVGIRFFVHKLDTSLLRRPALPGRCPGRVRFQVGTTRGAPLSLRRSTGG